MLPLYWRNGTHLVFSHHAAYGHIAAKVLEECPPNTQVNLFDDLCWLDLKFSKDSDHFIFNFSEHDSDEHQVVFPFASFIYFDRYLLTLHALVRLIIKLKPAIFIRVHSTRIILAENKDKRKFFDFTRVGSLTTKPYRNRPDDGLILDASSLIKQE
ncbi:hypothetical protein JTE90_022634 [Oedothorax gibbosus]|uniref:Uncharacterized protein n=1 Tax=Oedothorax gibbosus TaxID=931172 RepID=A0AAV6TU59_9ARAC|nr:hypothetical protein JTE90_022634 [Oedothorax gibbosus]